MNEYEIYFIGNDNQIHMGYFYGSDERNAKQNAIKQGVAKNKIRSVTFNETYRGYGHI